MKTFFYLLLISFFTISCSFNSSVEVKSIHFPCIEKSNVAMKDKILKFVADHKNFSYRHSKKTPYNALIFFNKLPIKSKKDLIPLFFLKERSFVIYNNPYSLKYLSTFERELANYCEDSIISDLMSTLKAVNNLRSKNDFLICFSKSDKLSISVMKEKYNELGSTGESTCF